MSSLGAEIEQRTAPSCHEFATNKGRSKGRSKGRTEGAAKGAATAAQRTQQGMQQWTPQGARQRPRQGPQQRAHGKRAQSSMRLEGNSPTCRFSTECRRRTQQRCPCPVGAAFAMRPLSRSFCRPLRHSLQGPLTRRFGRPVARFCEQRPACTLCRTGASARSP